MKILDPNEVLREFGLYGAEDVADFGSGAGHFSLAAARRLEGGRLFAIDIDRDMLKRLADEAVSKGIANLHALHGDIAKRSGVPLGDSSVDRGIIASALFQAHDRDAFAEEVGRIVRPGGKLLLVEWRGDHAFGPHHAHKVSEDAAHALFERHGFRKERDMDAGDLHYGMIFVRT